MRLKHYILTHYLVCVCGARKAAAAATTAKLASEETCFFRATQK